MDSLWCISVEAQNEKARDESRELLVDLHLRLGGNEYSAGVRQQIMQGFVDRSMSILREASKADSQAGTNRSALSVVHVLSDFLDRYEGKKQVKPELKQAAMQYQHFQPWNITVIWRGDPRGAQLEGQIQVSQYETLGAVRQKCAQQFGLELNEFQLRLKQGLVDPDEDDDSYVRDFGMSPQIYLLPNPAYDKQAHPKYLLAQNQEYFDLLLAYLAKGDANVVEAVWALLEKLPVNKKLQDDIAQLRGTEEGWEGLLDSRSTHKLLYSLKIIESIGTAAAPADANKQGPRPEDPAASTVGNQVDQAAWKKNFVERGGF